MNFNYYYNNVPGHGLCRNNLIYTSLMSQDQKVFCMWYHNDSEYHKGQNQVVDPKLMDEKFHRELHYLSNMNWHYPNLTPKILEVSIPERKIYLAVEGPDFWEQAGCDHANFDQVLPNWQEQMIDIIRAHKQRGWHKYSMHPSSYFVVNGRLKSINYFFTYHKDEPNISIKDVESHIYSTRQEEIRRHIESLGIVWDQKQPWSVMDQLCWASFGTNYPESFIEQVKAYV